MNLTIEVMYETNQHHTFSFSPTSSIGNSIQHILSHFSLWIYDVHSILLQHPHSNPIELSSFSLSWQQFIHSHSLIPPIHLTIQPKQRDQNDHIIPSNWRNLYQSYLQLLEDEALAQRIQHDEDRTSRFFSNNHTPTPSPTHQLHPLLQNRLPDILHLLFQPSSNLDPSNVNIPDLNIPFHSNIHMIQLQIPIPHSNSQENSSQHYLEIMIQGLPIEPESENTQEENEEEINTNLEEDDDEEEDDDNMTEYTLNPDDENESISYNDITQSIEYLLEEDEKDEYQSTLQQLDPSISQHIQQLEQAITQSISTPQTSPSSSARFLQNLLGIPPSLHDDIKVTLTPVEFAKLSTHQISSEPSTEPCPICFDPIQSNEFLTKIPCDHTFHTHCIFHWLRQESTYCPICRHRVAEGKPTFH